MMRSVWSLGAAGALLMGMMMAYGCGPDSSDPADNGSGGTDETGGAGNETGGNEETGGGGNEDGCAVVSSPLMTDFSDLTDGTTWSSGDKKGWASDILGGTFHYQATDGVPLDVTITNGGANLAATIAPGDYTGFGFYFDTNDFLCWDASAYAGISFTAIGDIGNTEMQVQVQQTSNYPNDDAKGQCDYGGVEDDKWDLCTNAYYIVDGVVEDEPLEVKMPWTELTGGQPIVDVTPESLVGIQFQFNCGDEGECPLNIVIDDLGFYTE